MGWTTKKSKPKLTNHIAYIIDASGSMSSYKGDVVSTMQKKISDLIELHKTHKDNTTITFVSFNDKVTIHETMLNLDTMTDNSVINLFNKHLENYIPSGSTALVDAVISVLDRFEQSIDAHLPTTSFLLEVITDGYENASKQSRQVLRQKLTEAIATDRVTIGFQVPIELVEETKNTLNLRDGEVIGWETSKKGFERSYRATASGMAGYYKARGAGASSVKGLYATNVATVKEVERNSTDITNQTTAAIISKEIPIKEWYETKYKTQYPIGHCFYQLTKRETIQRYKQILLRDKNTGEIYHTESRTLLNIPSDKDIKVDPGNHRKYDIFIQSTSTNRKLVRGTTVIVWKNAPVKGTLQVW